MSLSFGGLGLMSLHAPFSELATMVLGKGDIRSMFCLVVFFIVVLVLAYLTNPSENSFRAYLTEQSFRQHLSRLDDNTDDDHSEQDAIRSDYPPSKRGGPTTIGHTHGFGYSSPFHFANRASISLRTPKHVFHSFGIFTIAAMIPLAKSDSGYSDRNGTDRDGSMISDSWFIGAFGKWWRGGIIEAWYQDVVARSSDEESWSSGILGMKALDKLHHEYNGLPFTTRSLPPTRGSPPRLRNRERPSHRPGNLPARSSTPPPLPKSASLPLHTARLPHSAVDRIPIPSQQPISQSHSQPSLTAEQVRLGSPILSRSPSTLFDQSPRIVEVLRQISLSKASVLELRNQLTDHQNGASQSHIALQNEVDLLRERKRQEDASRLELKSRTKALEDSKRGAESMKRDAEKRLRAAQNARDDASQRMGHLDNEIEQLQQRLLDDEASVRQSKQGVTEFGRDIAEALEHKRQEIKVAEDVIAALNLRTKDLEDKLTSEKERLKLVRERAEIRKQDRSFYPLHTVGHRDPSGTWGPISYPSPLDPAHSVSSTTHTKVENPERSDLFSQVDVSGYTRRRRSSGSQDEPISPRPVKLMLSSISNFNGHSAVHARAALRAKGYSIFDDDIVSLGRPAQLATSTFSPFGDSDMPQPRAIPGILSPTSTSLIPAGLISSLDTTNSASKSFQSESDAFIDREWHGSLRSHSHHSQAFESQKPIYASLSTSPVSLHRPSLHDQDHHDPFEVRVLSLRDRDRLISETPMDAQRVSLLHRTYSDPNPNNGKDAPEPTRFLDIQKSSPRRWFSTSSKEKPKKGLNPDAKVFSLSRKSQPSVVVASTAINSSYDALNPNGLGPTILSSTASTSSSLLRAFAPSPAEREALQRALGGSTNTSLERLPSLSDVGSIPSSPSHAHAAIPAHQHSIREMGRLPSWLQSLPRIRKPNFSPWDDDEPLAAPLESGPL